MAGISPYVGVCFQGSDPITYSYRNHIPGLKVGDLAVVQVESGVFKVVRVKEVNLNQGARKKATKWLVGAIDPVQLDKYNALSQLVPPPEPEE